MALVTFGKIISSKIVQASITNSGLPSSTLISRNVKDSSIIQTRTKVKWCKNIKRKCPEAKEVPRHLLPECNRKPCPDDPPRMDDVVKTSPKRPKQRTWLFCREPCPVKIHTCLDDPVVEPCIDPKYEPYFKKPPCW